MKNQEVEKRLSDAIKKTAPNDINGVLSRISDEKGTDLIVMKTKKNMWKYLKGAVAACLALAIIGGTGAYYTRACAVSTVISLDVNPSIELKVNAIEKVISCSALNDEAAEVLADMGGGKDLKGTDIDVAVNALIGALVRNGYLDSISSAILVSIEDKNSDRAAKLRQAVTKTVDSVLAANSSAASVLSQTLSKDKNLDELAKKNNISSGKAALVEKVREINSSLNFDELSVLSVEELKDLEKTGAPALPIGRDKALEAAINAGGFKKAEVYTEVDSDIDDVPAHYDVEIKHNGTEYEYKVDAYTGEILESREEPDDDFNDRYHNEASIGTITKTEIGIEAAKEKALTHAGVKAEDAVFTKEKTDYGDGRAEYDLEFMVNDTEYEYEIDANTGDVTDFSVKTKSNGSSGNVANGEVSAEQAEEIALSHAGVNASDTYEIETELDYDDGTKVYEVEFKSGRIEYEYKIDAHTGAILEHDAELDD